MVRDDLVSATEAAEILGVTMNNLRQLQHRKTITWVERIERKVYYRKQEILDYKAKRQGR